jgi:hypothetical protein
MTTETTPVSDPNPSDAEAPDNLNIGEAPVLPVEEPKTPSTTDEAGVVEYEPTGDVGLDMALGFVGKAGIDASHPAMTAAAAGDFSLLRAVLSAKGIPGWEQYVALGEKAYNATKATNEAKAKADRENVYKVAGGEEQWNAIRTWAAANATPEEKAEVNAQLSAGGASAKMAVAYLASLYAKAGNVNEDGAEVSRDGTTRVPAANANGTLDRKAYAAAVATLHNKLGGNMEGSKEYAELQRRRQAHRD